jgi:hypothetical protein
MTRSLAAVAAAASLGLLGQAAQAQRLSGEESIRALQDGGYVIVMNQAPTEMRQGGGGRGGRGFGGGGFGGGGGRGGAGDGGGAGGGGEPVPVLTNEAENMLIGARHAIWYFQIPVGAVYTSPDGPASAQAEEVPFAEVAEVAGLAEGSADSGWLAAKVMEAPMAGSNSIVVTHAANIASDLGIDNLDAGDTLIVRPGAEPAVVGRLGLREWSVLAIELTP